MKLLEAIVESVKGKAAAIAVEHIETKTDLKDQGVACFDMLADQFQQPNAERMRKPIVNSLLEFAHGLNYENEDAFADQLMLYANSIRAKNV